MNEKEKNTIIMLALFQATVEQQTHLIKEYKHKMNSDFTVWRKHGERMLGHFEREIPNYKELILPLVDAIHDSFSEIKELSISEIPNVHET